MAQAPQIIQDLVQKFDRNTHDYRNPKYNETLIRVEFVNQLWKALGWDVDNEKAISDFLDFYDPLSAMTKILHFFIDFN